MIPDYSLIKPETIASLLRYVERGVPTGGFLRAVLENNLTNSFGRADAENCEALFHICAYVYNELPYECHGSPERVAEWLLKKQTEGEQ
jgi:hypothetical protein